MGRFTLYHAGLIVADFDAAMLEVGERMGCTFAPPMSTDVPVWTPDGPITVPFQLTYSREGPMHLELVGAVAGTIWAIDAATDGWHHIGGWVDDLQSQAEQMEARGFPIVARGMAEDGGYAMFTMHRQPHGGFLELVDIAAAPMMEQWWAGPAA